MSEDADDDTQVLVIYSRALFNVVFIFQRRPPLRVLLSKSLNLL